jgi:hypothetical protein
LGGVLRPVPYLPRPLDMARGYDYRRRRLGSVVAEPRSVPQVWRGRDFAGANPAAGETGTEAEGGRVVARFRARDDFEARFPNMDVAELRRWKIYWTDHASHLGPKVRKVAMKRVHRIDAAIVRKLQDEPESK